MESSCSSERQTRKGSEILIKFNKEKIADLDPPNDIMGRNILVLGFIGLIAGAATLVQGEDSILLFLAYLVFIFAFIALLKVGLKYLRDEEMSVTARVIK